MSAASSDALGTARDLGSAPYRDEDFPGCVSFHLPASEIDHYEGRLEFWDGATETSWRIPETPIQHEGPSRRLTQIEVSSGFSLNGELGGGLTTDALVAAALACTDQADFLRRIGEWRDAHAGLSSPADPEA